jgi:radical SAM protein with 4Fe4S-binding SPASM domain
VKDVKSPYLSLSDSVRHRKEYFGGILFNTRTGTMMDVDREVYMLISLIQTLGIIDVNDLDRIWFGVFNKHINRKSVIKIIEKLLEHKMLAVMPKGRLKKDYDMTSILSQLAKTQINESYSLDISSPETVHWAVTYKCELNCPDCYIRRHCADITSVLNTNEALTIIDKIAEAGVFQLAIGGGEPLSRADIISIVARAHKRKLVVHVTTGRYQHEADDLRELAQYIKSLQIGIKQEELLEHPENEKEKLSQLIAKTSELGLDIGANLMLSNSTLNTFEYIIDLLAAVGFKRLTLLRYKPPADIQRWNEENPDEYRLLEFERKFSKTIDTYPDIQFRVDCGLAFLERKLPLQTAEANGIRGCTAANRIVSIAPDGSIFPCSQLIGQGLSAGNLLTDDLKNVWMNSEVLKRYRSYRTKKSFKRSYCGQCAAKIHCGGCRVFANDALGADPGCPEPVLSPAKLKKYPKEDLYEDIFDIQESIGFTDAGFPYASFEQIQGWLAEEFYPKWLLRKEI